LSIAYGLLSPGHIIGIDFINWIGSLLGKVERGEARPKQEIPQELRDNVLEFSYPYFNHLMGKYSYEEYLKSVILSQLLLEANESLFFTTQYKQQVKHKINSLNKDLENIVRNEYKIVYNTHDRKKGIYIGDLFSTNTRQENTPYRRLNLTFF
jgi:hypothetical protein